MVLAPDEERVLAGRRNLRIDRGEGHGDGGRLTRRGVSAVVFVSAFEIVDRRAEQLQPIVAGMRLAAGRGGEVIGERIGRATHRHAETLTYPNAAHARPEA